MLRGRGKAALTGFIAVLGAAAGVALAATGDLTPQGCIEDDPPDRGCGGSIEGLGSPDGMAFSRDGRSLYVASAVDDAIVRLKRTASGVLKQKGCVADQDTGPAGCAQTAKGLDAANSLALSPDGRFLYAGSRIDNAIVRFARNPKTGALDPDGCIEDSQDGPDECAQTAGVIDAVNGLAISGDGRSLYALSQDQDAIVTFKRDQGSGALTRAGCINDPVGMGTDPCNRTQPGLNVPTSVQLSADGKSLYVTGQFDDALVRFKRKSSGRLEPKGCIADNDAPAEAGCATMVDGLSSVREAALSHDGRSLYTVSTTFGNDAVDTFKRNRKSGALTYQGCLDDDDSGEEACAVTGPGLTNALGLAVSKDGASVYVAAGQDSAYEGDDTIVELRRNTSTGALVEFDCIDDPDPLEAPESCGANAEGLHGAATVAISPDDASVYVASIHDQAIVRFDRER